MGENRKAVNAILRKNAERIERAKSQSATCPNPACKTRIEQWWNYCAVCGAQLGIPFACPPDGEK